MKFLLILTLTTALTACHHTQWNLPQHQRPTDIPSDSIPVQIWATHYYLLNVNPSRKGIPIRNMKDHQIGPILSEANWCSAAVEGSVRIRKKNYNYAGKRFPRQANCRRNKKSEKVRWVVTKNRFGTGSKDNPLVPFKTIACDLGSVDNSRPWLNGGYAKYGQRIYVPGAAGTKLPNGKLHDGFFVCGDIGGSITGNHIDVFIGDAWGRDDALKRDPFSFVRHHPSKPVQAYVLK